MQTSPTAGTYHDEKVAGLTAWIEYSAQPMCISSFIPYVDEVTNQTYWPTIDDAAEQAVNGAIVQMSYGRFDWTDINGTPYLTNRDGGHAVTLKLAFADNGSSLGPRLIHYRDPGTDEAVEDLNSNSDYDSKWPDTAANIEIATGLYGIPNDFIVTSIINPISSSEQYEIFDSVLALFPGGALEWDDVEVNLEFVGGGLGFVNQLPTPFHVQQVQGDYIIATVPDPQLHRKLVLVHIPDQGQGERAALYQVSHSGQLNFLLDLPPDTRCMTLGFGHTVYAATDNRLYELKIVGRGAKLARTFEISFDRGAKTSAIAYNEQHQQIYVVNNQKLYVISPDAMIARHHYEIRGIDDISTIAMDRDQNLYATNALGKIASHPSVSAIADDGYLEFEPLSLPGVDDAVWVEFDSYGRMYISDQDGLLEFEFDKQNGWQRASNPYYDGPSFAGRRVMPLKNRTNVRAGDLDPRQWYNIDPEDLVDVGPDIPD